MLRLLLGLLALHSTLAMPSSIVSYTDKLLEVTELTETTAQVTNGKFLWLVKNYGYYMADDNSMYSNCFELKVNATMVRFALLWRITDQRKRLSPELYLCNSSNHGSAKWKFKWSILNMTSGEPLFNRQSNGYPRNLVHEVSRGESMEMGFVEVDDIKKAFPSSEQPDLPILLDLTIMMEFETKFPLVQPTPGTLECDSFAATGLRLYQDHLTCDVDILLNSQTFCIHRAVLALRTAQGFRERLDGAKITTNSQTKTGKRLFAVDDMSNVTLDRVIRFLYCLDDPLVETPDSLKELLTASVQLGFDELENECVQRVGKLMITSTAPSWLAVAESTNSNALRKYVLEYLRLNAGVIEPSDWVRSMSALHSVGQL